MSGNGAINLIMVVDRLVAAWTCCKQRWPYYLDPLAAILRWIWASFRSPKPLGYPIIHPATFPPQIWLKLSIFPNGVGWHAVAVVYKDVDSFLT